MTTRAKRACSRPIKESNYSDVDDEKEVENDDCRVNPKKVSVQKKIIKKKLVEKKDTEGYDEKDTEPFDEKVADDNSESPDYEVIKDKESRRVVDLNKYFPHGLTGVNGPENTNLLYLFSEKRSCSSISYQKNSGRFDTSSLMEIVYIKDPKICRESIYFFPEYYEVQENPPIDSKPLMMMRPAAEENDPSGITRKEWPERYNAMPMHSFYEKMFGSKCDIDCLINNSNLNIKPYSLKIYYKDEILAFYLKIDDESMKIMSSMMDHIFSWLFRYNFVRGTTIMNETESKLLSDTFDFPEAIMAPGFTLTLRDYQLRSIRWMQSIEAVDASEINTLFHNTIMDKQQFDLKLKLGHTSYYMDLKENVITESPDMPDTDPLRFRGGILADDTGSGKTITVMGLIHSTPLTAEKDEERKLRFPELTKHYQSRATCIVCPSNIYQQWINEAKRCSPKLKVLGMSTIVNHQKINWNDVKEADIVVVSYQFLQNLNYHKVVKEFENDKKTKENQTSARYLSDTGNVVLTELHFHRIILDEFHELDANKVLIQEQVEKMKADYIWGLTGTPKLDDISRQFKYFDTSSRFNYAYQNKCPNARIEFKRKFIKRNVPDLKLPPIINETVWVSLSPQEMALLALKMQSSRSLKDQIMVCSHYQLSEKVHITKNEFVSIDKAQHIFIKAKEIEINRIQSLKIKEMNDMEAVLIKNPNSNISSYERSLADIEKRLKTAEGAYNYVNNVFKLINEPDNNECRICYDKIAGEQLSILPCSHIYCFDCISLALKRKSECPLCNHNIPISSEILRIAMKAPEEELSEPLQGIDLSKYGSKLIALYNYITTLMAKDPNSRIILFLQYSDLADFMADSFKELDIKCARVTGNIFQRRNAIANFKESKEIRLIMMSSEDSVSGINLTEATHVILLHPFYTGQGDTVDRAYEKQGISRAYRFGLNHQLKVIRFATRGTIEEEITLKRENMIL